MSLKGQRIGKIRLAQTAIGNAEAIVTNATGKDTCIDYLILYNIHTSAVTVTLGIVDDNAGSVGTMATTDVIYVVSLAQNETVFLGKQDLGIWLNDTNDTLKGYASVADKVNVFAFGTTMTDQA
jgi:hypothetical protein